MKILHFTKRLDNYLLKNRFILLLLVTPLFWWFIMSPFSVVRTWISYPRAVKTKISSLFSEERLFYISEIRWDSFGSEKNDLASRLYYNKATLLISDFFDYLSYLSPNFYFHAATGDNFSPEGVEAISGVLFFFWIVGLAHLIKLRRIGLIKLILAMSFLAFLGNQKNLAFLFPVAVTYVYFSYIGIERLPGIMVKRFVYRILQLYGLFIIIRSLWFTLI